MTEGDVTSFAVTLSGDTLNYARIVSSDQWMTIEQLSAQTGLSVRNIRSHRTLGLLPPPEVRDGIGYYDGEHVARLQLIQELQSEGHSLKGIKRLIDGMHGTASALLGLKRALATPLETQPARILTTAELVDRLGEDAVQQAMEKALESGLMIPVDGGRFEFPSPAILDVAEQLVKRGIALDSLLEVFDLVRSHSEAISRAFTTLFVDQLLTPLQRSDATPEQWLELVNSIEVLRPLASTALLAVFQQTMASAIETSLGEQMQAVEGE